MPLHPLYSRSGASMADAVPATQSAWRQESDTTTVHIEYQARAAYANAHRVSLHTAERKLRSLLARARTHARHTVVDGFHHVLRSGHLLVLSPSGSDLVDYIAPQHRHSDRVASPTSSQGPTRTGAHDPALLPGPSPVPSRSASPAPARAPRTLPPEVAALTFSSAVLTWAGAAPGQSHTRLAEEIRRSIASATRRPGPDDTTVYTDAVWKAIVDETATKVLYARRTQAPDADPAPGSVPTSQLAAHLTSERVDQIVVTDAVLDAAGPEPGQTRDDLRAELLDAIDAAILDDNISPGFSGRHQLYGDGWLLVLSPAGTHMVTARRSR